MKIKILYKILICFLAINLNAQEKAKKNLDLETKKIEELLIGEWKFIKTVDENNKKVEFITKDYKLFDGSDINVVAKGPEIKLNSDYTYTLKFTEKNSDNGFWKLVGTNKILYKMTPLKDSEAGKMIDEAAVKLNVEWKTDKDGNYLDTSTDEIISINEKEMRIRYEKKYILIYQKK